MKTTSYKVLLMMTILFWLLSISKLKEDIALEKKDKALEKKDEKNYI